MALPPMPPGVVGTSFYSAFRWGLGRRQHKRNLWSWNTIWPKVGRDRVGNYSDRHRLVRPACNALLTGGSFEGWGESDQIPTSSVACATCWKRHIANCRTKNIGSARQFQRRVLPLATVARIYRSRGRAAAVGMFLRLRAAWQEKPSCCFSTQSAPT